jgi:multidrug efflux pump
MNWTDIFIRKPVLSLVVSALVLVFGLKAIGSLPVNQYPQTQNAIVTITTSYYGADPETIAGFITQPLEASVAQAQGIDYLSSTSVSGTSTIIATLKLNYDSNAALTQIQTQISAVKNQLPPQAQQPVLTVQVGQSTDAMYMGFYSDEIQNNATTDYLLRVVKPKFDSIDGVQTAEIIGGRKFALRAWLDRERMAGLGVGADDVYNAMAANNYLSAVGSTKGDMVSVDLVAGTDLHSLDGFRKLVVKSDGVNIVYLDQVATVTLGSEDYTTNVAFSGKQSVFIGIKVAPQANLLDVAERVRAVLPGIQKQLPVGLTGKIVYDSTQFITTSISEVIKTLLEALCIVTVVIYLFLGSYRAVAIPVIAMPLS